MKKVIETHISKGVVVFWRLAWLRQSLKTEGKLDGKPSKSTFIVPCESIAKGWGSNEDGKGIAVAKYQI